MKKQRVAVSAVGRRRFLKNLAIFSTFFIVPRHVLGRGYLPPSDRVTLGFIGAGRQGLDLRNSFHTMAPEGRIVAVSDVFKAKMDAFVTQEGCKPFADFQEMLLQPDIDAIVVASPDHWHAVQVVKAAAAGKDIYCEKPLSLTVYEGRAMVKAVRHHKRILQTGSMQRSWPEFRQAVELVRNGYIGEVRSIKVNVGGPPVNYNLPAEAIPDGLDWDKWLGPNAFSPYNHLIAPLMMFDFYAKWRDYREFGGGGMTDWGAHMFDIAQWALDMDGKGPISVTPPDGQNVRVLTYRYENGVIMTREPFGDSQGVQFNGTEGSIEVHRGRITTNPPGLAQKPIGVNEKRVYFSDNHYKNFLTAVKQRIAPICDAETGHRSATVCNIGNIAYLLKRPLRWDHVREQFNDAEANKLLKRTMRAPYLLRTDN